MKKILSFVFLVSIFCLPEVVAQWGRTFSAPVGVQAEYKWVPSREGTYLLYHGNKQIGGFDSREGYYLPLMVDGKWGTECDPPTSPPAGCFVRKRKSIEPKPESALTPAQKDALLFGCEYDHTGPEKYWIKGKPATREEIERILENPAGSIVDISDKWHLTVISHDAAKRKQILDDLRTSPTLSAWSAKLRVQEYDPVHPVAKAILEPYRLEMDARFKASGLVLLIQAPEGPDGKSAPTPLYQYQGPEKLLVALRAVDPNYDPNLNKEPGPATPKPTPAMPAIMSNPHAGFLAVGGITALSLLLWPRRKT